jgi:hypothetical protein
VHCELSLEFHSVSPDNEVAGSSRLRLWWILAPVGASNTGRGFVFDEASIQFISTNCKHLFIDMLAIFNKL